MSDITAMESDDEKSYELKSEDFSSPSDFIAVMSLIKLLHQH